MKPNPRRNWSIEVQGGSVRRRWCMKMIWFTGTIEAALARADELESEVDFEVEQVRIDRRRKLAKK